MVYDTDYREGVLTALNTPVQFVDQGADVPGNFQVPGNASMITEVIVGVGPDWTADTLLGFSCGVQLSGGGIRVGHGAFPGPGGFTAGAATLSGGMSAYSPVRYQTCIPVQAGGQIEAHGCLSGEDCGALNMSVTLVYDGVPGRIRDMDYREEDLTAANTLVSLQTRQGVNNGDFLPVSTIGEIFVVGGLKPVAGPLGCNTGFHLSGAGLLNAGNYKFNGPSFYTQDDIALVGTSDMIGTMRYITNIPVKLGSTIRCQAQMLEDDVGTVFAMIGFGYY